MPTRDADTLIAEPSVLAVRLTETIQSVLASRPPDGRWSIAIPGGSVAEQLVSRLAAAPLDWSHAHVFFVDERAVPADQPDSNWRLCRHVASGTGMQSAHWHRMEADADDSSAACERYLDILRSTTGSPLALDVALLGVGEDGHVASIFPDRRLVDEAEPIIAIEPAAPKAPARRMTMTLPLLARARVTVFAALGPSKRDVMQQVLAGNQQLPAVRLIRTARAPLVLMDTAAAHPPR